MLPGRVHGPGPSPAAKLVLDVTSGKITVSIATALSGFNRIIVVSVLPNLLLTKITAAVTSRRIAITRANKRSRSQFTERCTPASQLFAFLTQAPSARRRCGLWREESVDFSGAFYKLKGVTIAPKPVQPDLPTWIGGSTDAAIRRTARIGTGW
jgi:Luciferase-like monooxygenase